MGQYIILGLIGLFALLIAAIVWCIHKKTIRNKIVLACTAMAFILCAIGLTCYFHPLQLYFSKDYQYRVYTMDSEEAKIQMPNSCMESLGKVSLRRQVESYDGYFKIRTDGSGYYIVECLDTTASNYRVVGTFVVGVDSLHPSVYIPFESGNNNRRKYDILEDEDLNVLREQLLLLLD